MISVSTDYFNSINSQMRNQMNFRVGVGVANTEMASNATYSDNGHLFYSDVAGLKNLYASNKIYVTAEPNMYLLDGLHEIIPNENRQFQGYVSSAVSGNNNTFTTNPKITIQDTNSSSSYDLIGMTLIFDEENNDYPTDFTIKYYLNSTLVRTKTVTSNAQVKYIDDTATNNINKIEIEFSKTHNYGRRIRVTSITLGIYEEFTGSGKVPIVGIEHNIEINPLMKDIPTNNFSFTVRDPEMYYDAENPKGIWKYTKKGQIVTLKYVYTVNAENETKEEVAGGRFYLTEQPTTEDEEVTFASQSRLESLEQTFNEGEYNSLGTSYYSLFEDLFEFAGLSSSEYSIDSALQNMSTTIPLPKKSVKECIQLLCQATGRIAFEDTTGKIWIKLNNSTVDTYYLQLKTNMAYPKYTEDTPALKNIIMTKYEPSVDTELSEIAKASFTISGTKDVVIDYSLSTDHTYTISGGTVVSGAFYAECAKLRINGSGTVSIVVNGKKIDLTSSQRIYNVNDTGYDCEVDMSMLSSDSVADAVEVIYAKYLQEVKRYDISYRGNPELRPNDIIQLETKFVDSINAMILSSKYTFDGGNSGELILKNFN